MGDIVFENQLFDHWLSKKSQDILTKMDKEQVTTEDMLILTLKAQTNHFHHMDVEFRDEFKKIDHRFDLMDKSFEQKLEIVDKKFEQRFDLVDKKFERLYSALMWGFGLMFTSIFGLYIKIFLG
jgi:hypothetical protein